MLCPWMLSPSPETHPLPHSDFCLPAVRQQVLFVLHLKCPLNPPLYLLWPTVTALFHTLKISHLHSWVEPLLSHRDGKYSSGSLLVTCLTSLFRTQAYLCGPPLMTSFLLRDFLQEFIPKIWCVVDLGWWLLTIGPTSCTQNAVALTLTADGGRHADTAVFLLSGFKEASLLASIYNRWKPDIQDFKKECAKLSKHCFSIPFPHKAGYVEKVLPVITQCWWGGAEGIAQQTKSLSKESSLGDFFTLGYLLERVVWAIKKTF